ncbi:MAG TPA: type II toxin-antitoxin system VapC family toxin [Desulfomonilia bacterium]|jgi:predicted nucleic acid-binding protein
MKIVADASAIIAVILNEAEKEHIIRLTENASIYAPLSVHWEIGNAFSSMLKRKLIDIKKTAYAFEEYKQIPIHYIDVDLVKSLKIADDLGIYAYDAYLLCCAKDNRMPLLSLDKKLIKAAASISISTLDIA